MKNATHTKRRLPRSHRKQKQASGLITKLILLSINRQPPHTPHFLLVLAIHFEQPRS
ncbi:MAG: hypothetical protein HY231_12480 [Acidobacteria bacterium]|nr:hypothetical protein [Acidobacteriota bacterium]